MIEKPVHRYSDPETGLIDGAVFIFVHGNEPEIIVLVEANSSPAAPSSRAADESGKLAWQYGLASIGSAKMHVAFDGKEIWSRPQAYRRVGRSTEPYYLMLQRSRD